MTTYVGDFVNPTINWFVKEVDGKFEIWIRAEDGQPARPHTKGIKFDDEDEAFDYLESMAERAEEQYDEYLEREGPEIARMERYEAYRREQ